MPWSTGGCAPCTANVHESPLAAFLPQVPVLWGFRGQHVGCRGAIPPDAHAAATWFAPAHTCLGRCPARVCLPWSSCVEGCNCPGSCRSSPWHVALACHRPLPICPPPLIFQQQGFVCGVFVGLSHALPRVLVNAGVRGLVPRGDGPHWVCLCVGRARVGKVVEGARVCGGSCGPCARVWGPPGEGART